MRVVIEHEARRGDRDDIIINLYIYIIFRGVDIARDDASTRRLHSHEAPWY